MKYLNLDFDMHDTSKNLLIKFKIKMKKKKIQKYAFFKDDHHRRCGGSGAGQGTAASAMIILYSTLFSSRPNKCIALKIFGSRITLK